MEVDPANKTERVLALLPGGPLVIELVMTIDGKPFQTHREEMIDESLKEADANKDGKTTWAEALAKPTFAGGRLSFYANQNEAARQRLIAQFDQDKDGEVNRYEVRGVLAQYAGGPAFGVQAAFGQQNPPVPGTVRCEQG